MGERAYPVADVRAAEAVVLDRTPPGALMQRAAAALAAVCVDELRRRTGRVSGSRVVLLVGAGNNGGDALWAGARLASRGAQVRAVSVATTAHPEGSAALRAAGGRVVDPAEASAILAVADLVVDGIVGLGGTAGLREPAAGLVRALDALTRRPVVVAVDLPSGVAADTGETPEPFLRADVTVTFGAPKPGLLLPPAGLAAGRVVTVDLGLDPHLPDRPAVERWTAADAGRWWPVPGPESDKYRRGVVGVIAGSTRYPGAAVLAVGGAARVGAGMVRYLGPEPAAGLVRARWPETVLDPGRVHAWAVGSGVDPRASDGQVAAVTEALRGTDPIVVDAGAIELATRAELRPHLAGRALLTPHAGELARFLTAWHGAGGPAVTPQDVRDRPWAQARRAADLSGATVLLKGTITVIAGPDGRCRAQPSGPAWLATAGSGDVLAGVAATALGLGLEPLDAATVAVILHGRAATLAGGPLLAQDLITHLPGAVAAILAAARAVDPPPGSVVRRA